MDTTNEEEPSWPDLLGAKNWKGLTHPLNLNLRKLILRCGDFCQATYDAFNNDTNSKYCGSSRYGKTSFFEKVVLDSAEDYKVVSFLYATAQISVPEAFLLKAHSREAWDRESNWIGYVAVTNDEVSKRLGRREIYVAWRGTTRNYEWINVLGAKLQRIEKLLRSGSESEQGNVESKHEHGYKHHAKRIYRYVVSKIKDDDSSSSDDDDDTTPKVMRGWLAIYTSDDPKSPYTKTSARTQLLAILESLLNQYKDENPSITFTGHSLGASLSILAAFDVAENIQNISHIPVSAFVFGSPQIGNKAFNEKLESYPNVNILHIRNTIDLIPHYPTRLLGYVYTGTELLIDTRKSPSLKDTKNPSDWHNLQAMLHIVAGWNGENEKFELKVKRSLALVNKSSEILKDECLVPGVWWVEKNKGMVIDENGEWGLASPHDEDLPVPPDQSRFFII